MGRLRLLWGLVGLGVARVRGRVRVAPHRVLLSVLGVALAIGLMTAVTGVSLGLASQAVVENEDVDYWIVPEGSETDSVVVDSGGLKLGNVHKVSSRIEQDDRVNYATPVFVTLLPVEDAVTGERVYLLTIGIVPEAGMEVFGLPAGALTPGDPHYANGNYDGPKTNELVLNDAAATVTNTSEGTTLLTPSGNTGEQLRVVNVSAGESISVSGTVPLALMHLGEVQAFSGATTGDQADQILVSTNDRSGRATLAGQYPQTTVVERSGLGAQQVTQSNLPFAMAVAALVAAVVVGVLFITTMMGLEVNTGRQQVGVLAAMGYSRAARSVIVGAETLCLAVVGGALGILLGMGGIVGINVVGQALLGADQTALFDPRLVLYALGVAVVIGIVGAVYPVLVGFRTSGLEGLAR